MEDIYAEIAELRRRGEPAALCTVITTRGSTPGKESMKMLVRGDGTTAGSIGGGLLEDDVRRAALEVMEGGRSRVLSCTMDDREYSRTGLICGGTLEVFVEAVSDPSLVVFGGGHISHALCALARMAGFRVIIAEDREEFADPDRFPGAAEVVCGPWDELVGRLAPLEHSYCMVVTRGHADDADVLLAMFNRGLAPRYLGMIGSRTKRQRVFAALEERGVDPAWLAGVETPAGLPIGAQTHGEIAVSIAARLIALRRQGAEGSEPGALPGPSQE